MFKIGYRTIKTALGVTIAIYIAQLFQLHSFPSAGIITILCIQVTKKKSFQAAFYRFLACIIAMFFSTIFFGGLGFNPVIIGLMLLVFIPTVVAIGAKEGIVTSSVIILHIYSAGYVSFDLILNELGLIVIGITVALIMNIYMPSVGKTLKQYQIEIERNFAFIFKKMSLYIRTGKSQWNGKEFMEVQELIQEAKLLAFRDVENHVTKSDDLYYHYFKMREKQFEIIERMLPLVASLPKSVPCAEMIAEFIDDLGEHIHPYNTSYIYLEKLDKMLKDVNDLPLPKSRQEFNEQSSLITLIKELEKYLIIKSVYKGLSRGKKGMDKKKIVQTKQKS